MKTVLIIDDEPVFSRIVSQALQLSGFDTQVASNGSEGFQIVETKEPDLILLDLVMPKANGFDFLKRLHENPSRCRIPIIILTGVRERDAVVHAAHEGAVEYVLKSSLSLTDLLQRIRACLSGAAKETQGSERVGSSSREAMEERTSFMSGGRVSLVTEQSHSAFERPNIRLQPTGNQDELHPGGSRGNTDKIEPTRDTILRTCREEFDLTAMPLVLQEVLAMCDSRNSALKDIANSVRKDQAIAARVLRLANSTTNWMGKPATDIKSAVSIVGLNAVRNNALGLLVMNEFGETSNERLSAMDFWLHSIGTATLVESLCKLLHYTDAEPLALSGLLHDLGRLVMLRLFPSSYTRAIETAFELGKDMTSIEQQLFGITHSELTRVVLESWQLPKRIVGAASLHDHPVSSLPTGLHGKDALIVGLANRLSHAQALGHSGNFMLLDLEEHLERLCIDPTDIETAVRSATEAVREMQFSLLAAGGLNSGAPNVLERASRIRPSPSISVLSDTKSNAMSLLLEAIHWNQPEDPQAVVVYARTFGDLQRVNSQLQRLEQDDDKLPVLIISKDPNVAERYDLGDRSVETLPINCGYKPLLEALLKLTGCQVQSSLTNMDAEVRAGQQQGS